MKEKRKNENLTEREKKGVFPGDSVRSFTVITAWAFLTVAIIIVSNVFPLDVRNQVYAASDSEKRGNPLEGNGGEEALPSGIAGVVFGVRETHLKLL